MFSYCRQVYDLCKAHIMDASSEAETGGARKLLNGDAAIGVRVSAYKNNHSERL